MAFSSYYPQLVSQRRELHQWPEPGWTEFTTTYYLAKKLKEWGTTSSSGQESRES